MYIWIYFVKREIMNTTVYHQFNDIRIGMKWYYIMITVEALINNSILLWKRVS